MDVRFYLDDSVFEAKTATTAQSKEGKKNYGKYGEDYRPWRCLRLESLCFFVLWIYAFWRLKFDRLFCENWGKYKLVGKRILNWLYGFFYYELGWWFYFLLDEFENCSYTGCSRQPVCVHIFFLTNFGS